MIFAYPTARELSRIGPEKVARMMADREGFKLMPTREVNAGVVQWIQRDNFTGLQQLRGLDGAPQHVNRVGEKSYMYTPGVYGEFVTITETELTLRAGSVTGDATIDVSDLVLNAQNYLIQRELDRMESIIWTLLTTGTFSVSSPGNAGLVFTDTFGVQTYTASVPWATVATATPAANLQAVQLLGRGLGTNFGAGAKVYVNRVTANALINNTNSADIAGRRQPSGATMNSLASINSFLLDQDLPQVVIYDEGYYDSSNTFQLFIPNNKAVVVGQRAGGEKLGEYVLTRNANNPGFAPGSYQYIVDKTGNAAQNDRQTAPTLTVHRGHSGGPTLYFPKSIVVMTV